MKPARLAAFLLVTLSSVACGGGGGGSGGGGGAIPTIVPSAPASARPSGKPSSTPAGSPTPVGSPTSHPTASPTVHPSTSPTANPTATPTPYTDYEPPDKSSKIRSTYGRVGLAQIFDYFPSTGAEMSSSQIASDASRYDLVWASFSPQAWQSANPQALISRYYIIEEDNIMVSGHNLQWWQQNHPDWILYACSSNGTPTHDYAYVPSDSYADVPLNFHDPDVVQYQVQSLISYAQANDYNALALDEVIFDDFMVGGNPELGQTENTGEYACGTWNDDGTFNTVYSGPSDPTWTQDILNWVADAKQAASSAGLAVIANHPIGSTSSQNEQALISNVDGEVDEDGFSDYGNYQSSSLASFFMSTYKYMEWVEAQGVAFIDIDRFTLNGQTSVTSDQLEYAIGTYMMGNEGNADLFAAANNGSTYGYGVENYHQEYATALGPPCSAMYEDSVNQQIYYRRFQNGMVVVNSGGDGTENATLPSDHTYTDLEGRAVTNPLPVASNDAWVLTTPGGNGCT